MNDQVDDVTRHDPPLDTPVGEVKRRIFVFADGTGNAYGGTPTNIRRLHDAIDLRYPDQIGYYIPGVGTQSISALRALDAATGFGVPANVRKLYRFLSWNWREGDEIWLFGFSRGAFTIRLLIGMIAAVGLTPRRHPETGRDLSHLEMQRHTRSAWRAYRALNAARDIGFTIRLGRRIRDGVLAVGEYLLGRHAADAAVRRAREKLHRGPVESRPVIRFVGLFDTVQAFGVPFEELRVAIDQTLFPLVFRDNAMSPMVARVRHALSIDDERTAFHPVRIAHAGPNGQEVPSRCEDVQEVWFAGVHSDVGGGYADDRAAQVPLAWMIEQMSAANAGLGAPRWLPGAVAAVMSTASAFGPLHDSRSGLGTLYRYHPRRIGCSEATEGGVPLVHESVRARMAIGTDTYAPVTLPDGTQVIDAAGGRAPLVAPKVAVALRKAASYAAPAAAFAVADPQWRSLALDAVWWRRVTYLVTIAAGLLLVLLPFLPASLIGAVEEGLGKHGATTNDAAASLLGFLGALESAVPGWVGPWIDALQNHPILFCLPAAVVGWSILWSGRQKQTIAERAHAMWFSKDPPPVPSGLSKMVSKLRDETSIAARAKRVFTGRIVPGAVVILIYFVLATVALRAIYLLNEGAGAYCAATKTAPTDEDFSTDAICWDSGRDVVAGHSYRLVLTMTEPWFDRTFATGMTGFGSPWPQHLTSIALRRQITAAWLQPIARIGATGASEWALTSATGEPAGATSFVRLEGGKRTEISAVMELDWGTFPTKFVTPLPSQSKAVAAKFWQEVFPQVDGPHRFVAHFVAAKSGRLFLFVNDAVVAVPFLGTFEGFYRNNSGRAKVTLEEIAP